MQEKNKCKQCKAELRAENHVVVSPGVIPDIHYCKECWEARVIMGADGYVDARIERAIKRERMRCVLLLKRYFEARGTTFSGREYQLMNAISEGED